MLRTSLTTSSASAALKGRIRWAVWSSVTVAIALS
jgi:hypothetical protein